MYGSMEIGSGKKTPERTEIAMDAGSYLTVIEIISQAIGKIEKKENVGCLGGGIISLTLET